MTVSEEFVLAPPEMLTSIMLFFLPILLLNTADVWNTHRDTPITRDSAHEASKECTEIVDANNASLPRRFRDSGNISLRRAAVTIWLYSVLGGDHEPQDARTWSTPVPSSQCSLAKC